MRLVIAIMLKELLDTVRDRRTLVISVLIPILMMPAMMLVFTMVMDDDDELKIVAQAGSGAEQILSAVVHDPLTAVPATDPVDALGDRDIDAILNVAKSGDGEYEVSVLHTDDHRSLRATEIILARLADVNHQVAAEKLARLELDPSLLTPVYIDLQQVPIKAPVNLPGIFFSLIVVIWATVGAMYPAADVTAGERERQTLDNLLMTPAGDGSMISGKFLSVFAISLVTLVLAVVATLATVRIGDVAALDISFAGAGSGVIAGLIIVVLTTVALIASSEIVASAYARSFREAQTYLTPIFMAVIIPGILIAVAPRMLASKALYYVPLVNNTLVINELTVGTVNLEHIAVVAASSIIISVLLLMKTAQLLRSQTSWRRA